MPVSRDRLSRPVDISTLLRSARRRVNLVVDEPGLRWTGLSSSPARNVSVGQDATDGTGPGGPNRVRVGAHRAGFGRGRNFNRTPIGRENRTPIGRENRTPVTVRRGRGPGRGSVLPSWHPRTPLRDITTIVRAIERRRAQIHNDQRTEVDQQETNAQLEQELSVTTPIPTISIKPRPSPAPQLLKIFVDDKKGLDSDFLTPQKKLLNSIEKVREIWLEDQRKLEKTPAAKKAERERKVSTLMSMR